MLAVRSAGLPRAQAHDPRRFNGKRYEICLHIVASRLRFVYSVFERRQSRLQRPASGLASLNLVLTAGWRARPGGKADASGLRDRAVQASCASGLRERIAKTGCVIGLRKRIANGCGDWRESLVEKAGREGAAHAAGGAAERAMGCAWWLQKAILVQRARAGASRVQFFRICEPQIALSGCAGRPANEKPRSNFLPWLAILTYPAKIAGSEATSPVLAPRSSHIRQKLHLEPLVHANFQNEACGFLEQGGLIFQTTRSGRQDGAFGHRSQRFRMSRGSLSLSAFYV